MQTSPLGSNFRIAPNRPKRRAWIVGIAIVAILGGLIFIFGFGASFSPQGNTVAQKLLATLTPAPTRTLPGPSPTLVEMKFPTLSAERQSALAANAIFVQAEKELDSQPQSVIDLLLTRLPQFTSKSDLEDAYSYLGRAELVLHHYHAAAGYFKQLYALEPSPEYLYSLAVAYDLDGDWQNALTSYRALSESNGNNAAVYRVSAQQRAREIEQRLYAPAP